MKKFYQLKKARLTNGQHFAYMASFVSNLEGFGEIPAKLKTLFDAMKAALAKEDECYKLAQGSDITEPIREADSMRDNCYNKMRNIVKAWTGCGFEPQATNAKALSRIFNTYRINTDRQMDEESGDLVNLVTDLSTTEMKEKTDSLGVTVILEKLKEANERTIALLNQRDKENATKVAGALRTARINSDKAYSELTEMIEAYNRFEGGFDNFIVEWNATTNRYQDMLNRKTGSTKQNKPDEDDTTPGGSGSTGGPDDEGTGGDQGNTGNEGTGGDQGPDNEGSGGGADFE